MHTIQSIKRNATDSAITNGAESDAEIHAYAFGYLSAYLAQSLNEIDHLEAVHGKLALRLDVPELLKRQAG